MNLLSDAIFSISSHRTVNLPGLLAAMARDEVAGFTRLRPHQRPAWHMFLVQLAALALAQDDQDDLPENDAAWHALLCGLTVGHGTAWRLVEEDAAKPAFLQPADPGGLKWAAVETADALDMTITARNHDLKQTIAWEAEAEDWVFALVSLQTMEGYGGAGNHGIARMNGGSSSRPMLGLCPISDGRSVNPSAWWQRDVRRLLELRKFSAENTIGTAGGPALLWCLPWPEGQSLDATQIDPWFIEICRRVRLIEREGRIAALRSTSQTARVLGKPYRGVLGDPWCPVAADGSKALTLGGGQFDYKMLSRLLGTDWRLPALAKPQDEGDMLLVAEAFARGNSKTEGFRSRTVFVPGDVKRSFYDPDTLGSISKSQLDDIKKVDTALKTGLAVMAARGKRNKSGQNELGKNDYAHSRPARVQLDAEVDAIFFDHLWAQLRVINADEDTQFAARTAFREDLKTHACRAFKEGLGGIPCSTLFRPRATARARKTFENMLFFAFGATQKEEKADA